MIRIENILDKIRNYNPQSDVNLIRKAYIYSAWAHEGKTRFNGEPYISHPLEVAGILADLRMDDASVVTGLLHDTVEDSYRATLEDIQEAFGEETAFLVDGLTKIDRMTLSTNEEIQAENFRKMLLAMARDIRVILIKLADRLHNMRTLQYHKPEKRLEIARETMDIYAPLANRLGINWIKSELEDLSFKHMEPEAYLMLDEKMNQKKLETDKYIQEVIQFLTQKLADVGLAAQVKGRPKHYYGIYRKMQNRGVEFEDVFDIIAFRIILNTIKECYEALGVIHALWRPVPSRFKDFVAMPKANMYQSLHTSVVGPHGERVEIQIRTWEMDRVAESGIAAHWKYKEGRQIYEKDAQIFNWLKQLLEWQQDLKDPRDFLETVRVDLFPDEVYVFTPRGEVKAFPKGATPVDFAFYIHTDVGHRCTGAKVNGRLVPLRYQLRNGEIVEILTSPNQTPSKDWLSFVVTARARTKIRYWIRQEERARSITLGREICDKEFRKHGASFSHWIKTDEALLIIKEFSYQTIEDLMAGVGYGKVSAQQIFNKTLPPEQRGLPPRPETDASLLQRLRKKTTRRLGRQDQDKGIKIKGIHDIMVRFSRCCNPVSGESVKGFITRGRGITVHVANCPNIRNADPERVVDVQWDTPDGATTQVNIRVKCINKPGLLASITSSFGDAGINISGANVRVMADQRANCTFLAEVKDLPQLEHIISSIKKIKGVHAVERVRF
jgi:guanosine-3',5'-bis(diphosphate) 3'-pyrophosphohydrolase